MIPLGNLKRVLLIVLLIGLAWGQDTVTDIDGYEPIKEINRKDNDGIMRHWKVYDGYAIIDNRIQNTDLIQETWISNNKDILLKVIVPGSPPPDEYDQTPVQLSRNSNAVILGGVPATSWTFGCSPTSGQMLAGYYDRHGYNDLYTGPINNGIFPLDNSIWGSTVINGELRDLGPLSASMMGLDGRIGRGHVDDYWYQNDSDIDPYYGNWTEHDWSSEHACLADFMGTSQFNNYGMSDGITTFWYYMGPQTVWDEYGDGSYGIKKYFENQGYTVDSYYNQITAYGAWSEDNNGFTFQNYKNEIDDGRPLLIHVEGHTMLGVGYDEATYPETIYFHNTWDYDTHSMEWNGSYLGMAMYGVSCFQLSASDVASADFSASSTSGDAPLSVQFTDHSISWDGEIIDWSWNFGDGNTSTDQNPAHIFNEPGEYTITLSVTDNNGNIVTETKENYINVSQPPDMCAPNNFDINNMNNSISLSWDTRPGEYEELRYFTGWWQNAYYWSATLYEGAGHGVRFAPTSAYDIDSVHIAVRWDGWPNDEHEGPVAVQIYNENNDMPNDLIWSGETSTFIQDWSSSFGTPGSYGWALIYPELSNLSGDYFVFVGQGEGYEGEGLLYNWSLNNLDNIYVVENGTFSQGLGSYLNGDPMTAPYLRNYGSEEYCYYNDFLYHNIYRNGELIFSTTSTEYTDILIQKGEYCYQVSNVYEAGESELTSIMCTTLPDEVSVYPGDTDNNGIVDALDVLPIGVYFFENGTPRETGFIWSPANVLTWETFPATYADANGDGVVNEKDIIGIGVNWGNIHEVSGKTFVLDPNDGTLFKNHQSAFQEIYNSLSGEGEVIEEIREMLRTVLGIQTPEVFSLHQNYPNPFNPTTTIQFDLPTDEFISLTVYDILGRTVIEPVKNTIYQAGTYSIVFDGSQLSSGVYYYTLQAGKHNEIRKMLIIK